MSQNDKRITPTRIAKAIAVSLVFSLGAATAKAGEAETSSSEVLTEDERKKREALLEAKSRAQTEKVKSKLPDIGGGNTSKAEADANRKLAESAAAKATTVAKNFVAASQDNSVALTPDLKDQVVQEVVNTGMSAGIQAAKSTANPFLGNLTGSAAWTAEHGLDFNLQTIGVLSGEGAGNNWLLQLGAHNEMDRPTGNVGLVYRYVTPDKKALFGANVFYDHDFEAGANRVGVGVEAATQSTRWFANAYAPLSDSWYDVKQNDDLQERAASGYDLGLSYSPAKLPGLDLTLKGTWWQGERVDVFGTGNTLENPNVWTAKVAWSPVPLIGISLEHDKAIGGPSDTKVMLNFNYKFGVPMSEQTLTGAVGYSDAENDPQGTHTYQWYRADNAAGTTNRVAIALATNLTYVVTSADQGKYLVFGVVPKATTGNPNVGIETFKVTATAVPGTAPTASPTITGTVLTGETLTGAVGYSDAENDPQGTHTYQWYRADNAAGTTNRVAIPSATNLTYVITAADQGKYLVFGVVPKSSAGNPSVGIETFKVTATAATAPGTAPTVDQLEIRGTFKVGQTLEGIYRYEDAENDLEDTSASGTTYQWWINDLTFGVEVKIPGATGRTFVLRPQDAGSSRLIRFQIVKVKSASGSPNERVGPWSVARSGVVAQGAAPTANPTITGTTLPGHRINVSDGYQDAEGDAQDIAGTLYTWHAVGIGDLKSGYGNEFRYLDLTASHEGMNIVVFVTPRAATGSPTQGGNSQSPARHVPYIRESRWPARDMNGGGLFELGPALSVNLPRTPVAKTVVVFSYDSGGVVGSNPLLQLIAPDGTVYEAVTNAHWMSGYTFNVNESTSGTWRVRASPGSGGQYRGQTGFRLEFYP